MKSIVAFGLGLVVVLAGTVCLAGDPGDAVLGDPGDGMDISAGVQIVAQCTADEGMASGTEAVMQVYPGAINGFWANDLAESSRRNCLIALEDYEILILWVEMQARVDLVID